MSKNFSQYLEKPFQFSLLLYFEQVFFCVADYIENPLDRRDNLVVDVVVCVILILLDFLGQLCPVSYYVIALGYNILYHRAGAYDPALVLQSLRNSDMGAS